MTKRIFQSICLTALGVFFASVLLFMGVLYEHYTGVQRRQLRMQTELAAQGTANEGLGYFDGLDVQYYRITWIDKDGSVLYDSQSNFDGMENHLEREEVKEAVSEGLGESSRYSVTLMERAIYCAKSLPDGTILRLSMAQNTVLTLLLGMIQPICIIFGAALGLSLLMAYRLSKSIVKPLNKLDLDEPMKHEGYDELSPFFERIAIQQRKIRRQENELRQRKSEFEAVTMGMEEGIVLFNKKQIILAVNPAAARILHTDQTCVGKYLLSVNRSIKLQELLGRAGEGRYAEMKIDDGGRSYQFSASPVLSEGLVSGIVFLILDITEKEKSEQMRREFTANVSHELRTPLHTISGYAELLANDLVKPEDIKGFSGRIYEEARRMIRLVEDIMQLSRLDEGAADMNMETVDLFGIAQEVQDRLSKEAREVGVQFVLEGGPVSVYGIPQLLREMIYNLCDNGIKYNRRGGKVSIIVNQDESGAELIVSDNGIGIPKEHQERVFERFYRVDKSHSKEIGGTGLGLSIVKHAAKLNHAAIDLHSIPNEGTTVSIHFPKTDKEAAGKEH